MNEPLDPESLARLARSLDRRLSLGQLALLNGFLSEPALEECLREERATGKPLGGLLVSRGHLTPGQLAAVLKEQALSEHDGVPGSPDDVERMVGRYAIVRTVGAGGAGIVWKAWDTQLERWVALKEPRLDRGLPRERFLREARAAAQLRHANLIPIFEVGEHDGLDYIVMDFVEGRRLDELSLDPRAGAAIVAQVCDAVDAMHACGVVHRDIKPQNILVDAQGVPHLGDFGLAKMLESSPLTIEGGFLGTPQYAAPEQAAGQRAAVGPAVDVYGLGATLYQVLSGHAPFENEEVHQILDKKRREIGPRSLAELGAAIPGGLALVVARAMESRPGDRYSSAAVLGEDLRRFLRGESLSIRPPTLAQRTWRGMRRRAPRLALAALLLGGLGIGAVLGLRQSSKQEEAFRRDAAYELARQRGDELWTRALGYLRSGSPDRDGLRRTLEESIQAFGEASAEVPSRPYPWLMRGRCLRLRGETEEAVQAWTRALELDPAFGPALLERAKHYLSAVARLRVPSVLHADATAVRFGVPEPETAEETVLRKKGEQDLAAARGARGLDPSSLLYLEGVFHLGSRDFDRASAALSRYTRENPWDAAALAMQGAAEYYSGRFTEAEATWTAVVALDPRAERFRARGHVRYCLGKFAAAISDYEETVRLSSDPAEALCDLGAAEQALSRQKQDQSLLERSVGHYSKALALRPAFARARNNRGTALAEKKDYEGAHADLLEAQRASPFAPESYVNRGVVFQKQGNTPEAVEEFDAALEIDPSNLDALANRGRCRMLLLEFGRAVDDFTQALALGPRNAEVLFQRAQARYFDQDVAKAVLDLKEALRHAPAGWPRRPQAESQVTDWSRER